MNNFSIEKEARSYVEKRFPNASEKEKDKIIKDWANKISKSEGVVSDFKARVIDPRGLKILDLGSGNGGLAIAFSKAGAEVSGVDIEKELVDVSRRQADFHDEKINFHLYDGATLPFGNGYFDAIVSVSVLEHVTDPVNFFKEAWRVLKPGGFFYLAFPNRLWPKETHTGLWGITYLPAGLAIFAVKLFGRNPLEDNNLHFYTFWKLKKFLKLSGVEGKSWMIIEESGAGKGLVKNLIKKTLSFFGISYKAFLPHIMAILKKPE